jgi:hypothetical protein
MTRLQAHFHFAVNDLSIAPEMLGREDTFSFDGMKMFIRFPQDEHRFDDQPGGVSDEVLFVAGSGCEPDGGRYKVVRVVRIGVWFETQHNVTSQADAPGRQEVMEGMRDLFETAQQAMKAYLDEVAITHGQFWLGTRAELPQPTWKHLVYLEDGTPTHLGHGGIMLVNPARPWLDAAAHIAVLPGMNHAAQLPESFLRDARALITRSEHDPAHALLCAAIACELKIKHAAITGVHIPGGEDKVKKMLARHAPITSFLDVVRQIETGHSPEEQNEELCTAVRKLFEDRNRIAHEGHVPDLDTVRGHVTTAVDALAWIDSLLSPQ